MCIIIYKPAGAKMPDEYIFALSASSNPDGFGLMTPRGVVKAGSWAEVKYILDYVPDDMPAAMHFRFATHGSVCMSNIHPFSYGDVVLMHNGVLPIKSRHNKTDSELFLHKIGKKLNKFGINSDFAREVINAQCERTGSKFALMNKRTGEFALYGDFITAAGGYKLSNLRPFRYNDLILNEDGRLDGSGRWVYDYVRNRGTVGV